MKLLSDISVNPVKKKYDELIKTTTMKDLKNPNTGKWKSRRIEYNKYSYCHIKALKSSSRYKTHSEAKIIDIAIKTLYDIESGSSYIEIQKQSTREQQTRKVKEIVSLLRDLQRIEPEYPYAIEDAFRIDWMQLQTQISSTITELQKGLYADLPFDLRLNVENLSFSIDDYIKLKQYELSLIEAILALKESF